MEKFVSRTIESGPELFELDTSAYSHGITAGFTGRKGGVSQAPYDSFNLAYHVNDQPEDVLQNRKLLCDELKFDYTHWVSGEQVHSNHIEIVTTEHAGKGWFDRESAFQNTDGLITNVPGILLTSFYADCVPLYFIDPVRQVVGLAHAGWKGTVANIAGEMIETMRTQYGSVISDIHTAIGPSIGGESYEVDHKVMDAVNVWESKLMGNGEQPLYARPGDNGKTWLDLKQLNRQFMIFAGIPAHHIEMSNWCTYRNHDLFFSYRADGGTTGRMASWIGIETE